VRSWASHKYDVAQLAAWKLSRAATHGTKGCSFEALHPCRVCPGGKCSTQPGGAGIPDADFVVFVTALATRECGPSTGAHAVTCTRDEDNWYGLPERPLVGYINFCPPSNGEPPEDNPKSVDGLVDTAVHELIHTLFMSSNLFEYYINADGSRLKCAVSPFPFHDALLATAPHTRRCACLQPPALRCTVRRSTCMQYMH
jgi:Leishmanolysin